MIIITILDDFFFFCKTSVVLLIILSKLKKQSKIKSEYLDLFIKKLPLTGDQDEDILCNADKPSLSSGVGFAAQLAPGEPQAPPLRQHRAPIPGPRPQRHCLYQSAKQTLPNVPPSVRRLGPAGSEPSMIT